MASCGVDAVGQTLRNWSAHPTWADSELGALESGECRDAHSEADHTRSLRSANALTFSGQRAIRNTGWPAWPALAYSWRPRTPARRAHAHILEDAPYWRNQHGRLLPAPGRALRCQSLLLSVFFKGTSLLLYFVLPSAHGRCICLRRI